MKILDSMVQLSQSTVAIHQGCVPMSAAKGRLAAAAVDVAWGKQFATRWSGA